MYKLIYALGHNVNGNNHIPFDLFSAVEWWRIKLSLLFSINFRCKGTCTYKPITGYHIKWKARLSGTIFSVLTTATAAIAVGVHVTPTKSKVFWRLLSSAKTKDEPLGRARDGNGNNVQTREWAIRARNEYQKPNADRAYCSYRWSVAGNSKFGMTTSGHLYIQPYTHAALCVYTFYSSRIYIYI